MPNFNSVPNFNLPESLSQQHPGANGSRLRRLALPGRSLLRRLVASFARADAVHQARLDACWQGPERYLMARYACPVR